MSTTDTGLSPELAVEVNGLTKRFPAQTGWRTLFKRGSKVVALNGVDLAIARGQTYGILGPNGAGKTTLIKILSTLITPDEGTARVAGFDVVRQQQQVRRRIGLIYGDQRSFYWRLTLWENLRFYGVIYGLAQENLRRRIDQSLEMVGLTHAAHMRMHSFSSGMKQRAAIARGLLNDPEIVFLDEPTTSVDPIHSYEIRRMIKERVAGDGHRTVILTTNTMDEAEFLCDRLALIAHGRIVMTGDVADLRQRFQPEEVYVLEVSDAGEAALQHIRSLKGVLGLQVLPPIGSLTGLRLELRRNMAVIPEIVASLVRDGIQVWSCTRQELSLDEMFRLAFDGTPRIAAFNQTGRAGGAEVEAEARVFAEA